MNENNNLAQFSDLYRLKKLYTHPKYKTKTEDILRKLRVKSELDVKTIYSNTIGDSFSTEIGLIEEFFTDRKLGLLFMFFKIIAYPRR